MNHKIDLKKPYAPYFLAYIKANDLKNGDSYKLMDYKDWIMEQHDAFAEIKKLDRSKPYSDDQVEQFIKFINGEG